MKNKILYVVAAGSGGHILPALTLCNRWLENNPGGKVIFWGSSNLLDQKIISQNNFLSEVIKLKISKFGLKKIGLLPVLFFQLFFAFCKSFFKSIKDRPAKIISTGGLISIPVCLGCKFAFTPVEIYELNVQPGKAVKFLMPFANKIFIAFKKTKTLCKLVGLNFEKKCEITNYPVRFTQAVFAINKSQIIEQINKNTVQEFSLNRKTIFLLGGSQGSLLLNQALKNFLEKNNKLNSRIQIIHQTGNSSTDSWRSFYQTSKIPAVVFDYNENIQNFYLLSDLIICRAGAGTLFEIEFFKKKCIIVPLVAASTSHQVFNAQEMAAQYPDLFKIVWQKDLNSEIFGDAITRRLDFK
jgi:UDP-N-acetylglucosamine--N-acetylmuramyl-(pentapeptide) pyrophosphoryl-undecaprenol N-acetylglucosamine transferase